jgi:drug/metabolite transporter (DMT)-like permease
MAALLALLSIVVWSSLAFLNSRVNALPPFLSVGVALCVGGLVGLARAREWRVPLRTFAVGVGGIFGYHALLFAAFRISPAVEVNLINYLWPLLIVLLSPLILKGFKLGPRHVAGALLGLAGAALIATGGSLRPDAAYLPGYLLAAAAALAWACYSLLTKRLPPFPTGAVGGFCLASGILSLGVYFLELAASPGSRPPTLEALDWLFLVLLGLGPMGGAFYAWDAALKRGDPRVIGALSYLTPLLSTLNLVLLGGKSLSPIAIVAMSLIVAGAALGSLEVLAQAMSALRARKGAR